MIPERLLLTQDGVENVGMEVGPEARGSVSPSPLKEPAPIRRMPSIDEKIAERLQPKLESSPGIDDSDMDGDAKPAKETTKTLYTNGGEDKLSPELPRNGSAGTVLSSGIGREDYHHRNGSIVHSNSKLPIPETPGTRIARLRAAFESKSVAVESPKFERPGSRARPLDTDAEIARLKLALERETELRHEYEEKMTTLEEEIDSLQDTLEQRDAVWRDEWERKSKTLLQERGEAIEQLKQLENRMKGSKSEANDLQRQLLDLKHSISTSTRTESQVTDSVFALEMGILNHEVQNWVVQNFRKARVPESLDNPANQMLKKLRDIGRGINVDGLEAVYEAFDANSKLVFFQATVMHFLMEIFDEPYLFGLPADGEVRSAAKQFEASATPVAYNRWRSVTFDLIRKSHGSLKTLFDRLIETAADRIVHDIEIVLSVLTEVEPTESRLVSLKAIMSRSVEIAHQFRVQRALFEFKLPVSGALFDSGTMEEIFSQADEDPAGKPIACAVFPHVTKIGDEQGDNVQLCNVIAKARVLLKEL